MRSSSPAAYPRPKTITGSSRHVSSFCTPPDHLVNHSDRGRAAIGIAAPLPQWHCSAICLHRKIVRRAGERLHLARAFRLDAEGHTSPVEHLPYGLWAPQLQEHAARRFMGPRPANGVLENTGQPLNLSVCVRVRMHHHDASTVARANRTRNGALNTWLSVAKLIAPSPRTTCMPP